MNVHDITPYLEPWYGSIGSMALMLIVCWVSKVLYKELEAFAKGTTNKYDDFIVEGFKRPVRVALIIACIHMFFSHAPSNIVKDIPAIIRFCRCLYAFCIFWGLYSAFRPRVMNGKRDGIVYRFLENLGILEESELKAEGKNGSNTIAEMVSFIIRIMMLIIGVGIMASELGYNLGALLTSLSLGTAVIAYGAKDMLINVFGSMVIIIDKPFVIGDWIKTPEVEGFVENITFRSTLIRTLSGELVYIPSSLLTNSPIINVAQSEKKLIALSYSLALETKIEDIEDLIKEIKEIISTDKAFSQYDKDIRVYLGTELSESFMLMVNCFALCEAGYKHNEYIEVRNKLNMDILHLIGEHSIKIEKRSSIKLNDEMKENA